MPSHTRHNIAGRFLLFLLLLGALLAVAPAPARAASSHLRRYPYLTDLVQGWVTINWATDQAAAQGSVRWGERGVESCTAHSAAATSTVVSVNQAALYQWRASLQLKPDTEYCYRVYQGTTDLLGSDASPRFWSQLPAGSDKSFSFVVFGDWGAVNADGSNAPQASIMRLIASSGARFALTTGDNGYPSGSQANYGDLVQRGQDISAVFGPKFWAVAGASMPLFPAIGNHGLGSTTPNHPHLLNWPQDHAVALSGGRYTKETYCCQSGTASASYASAWYAFDAGAARFYVLHAAWSEANVGRSDEYGVDYAYHWASNTAQYRWLVADLAAHPGGLKFAFLHYPIHSDNATEGQDPYLQGTDRLEGLLSRNGVNIAFSGHAHMYQRNIKPNSHSLVTYVTGGGGAKVQPIAGFGCSALDAYGIGWSYSANSGRGKGSACGAAQVPSSDTQVFHFLLVTVKGTRVMVKPINALGKSFDVQTYEFGASGDTQPPLTPATPNAVAVGAGRVELSWPATSDDVGVAGYTLFRDGAEYETLSADLFAFADTNVAPDTAYRYALVAFDAAGNRSDRSEWLDVHTPPDTTAPAAPASLSVAMAPQGADLRWAASSDDVGVTGYVLLRDGDELARLARDELRYLDATVRPASTYRYRVLALDRAGNRSAPSPEAVLRTPAALPPPVQYVPVARR